MEHICPICKTHVIGSESKQGLAEQGYNAVSKYGYTSTAKHVGELVGGTIGSVLGPYGAIFGAAALGHMLKGAVGDWHDQNINTRNLKPLSFSCPRCKCSWKSNETTISYIIKRYYNQQYVSKKKEMPSQPIKEKYIGKAKHLFLYPLYLLLCIALWNTFSTILYYLTFTLLDVSFSFGALKPYVIGGIVIYEIALFLWRVYSVENKYKTEMDYYNETVPKVKAFNEKLKKDLDKQMNEKLKENENASLFVTKPAKSGNCSTVNITTPEHYIENNEKIIFSCKRIDNTSSEPTGTLSVLCWISEKPRINDDWVNDQYVFVGECELGTVQVGYGFTDVKCQFYDERIREGLNVLREGDEEWHIIFTINELHEDGNNYIIHTINGPNENIK